MSKLEYLKKYMNEDEKEEKKLKRKKKIKKAANNIKIVDTQISLSKLSQIDTNGDEFDLVEEKPLLMAADGATILTMEIQQKEKESLLRWKTLNEPDANRFNNLDSFQGAKEKLNISTKQKDFSIRKTRYNSPKRSKKRHDSSGDDLSVVRSKKRHDSSDDDLSPVRSRKRHDSSEGDLSPVRSRKRHDSSDGDLSPVRSKKRHDSSDDDLSPVRSKKRDDSNGDSDLSPARPRQKHNSSDDDLSPPRQKAKQFSNDTNFSHSRKKKGNNLSDNDLSPVRDKYMSSGKNNTEGQLRSKRKSVAPAVIETSAKSGLRTKDELRIENEKRRKADAELIRSMDSSVSGKGSRTVYRDRKTGKMIDLELEAQKKKPSEEEIKNKEKQVVWGKGVVQTSDYRDKLKDDIHEMEKPLARYKDDKDLESLLRSQERDGDPMANFLKGKKEKKSQVKKPRYQGPPPAPNRFNIWPGYRYDGVDRSNGFEKKRFMAINKQKSFENDSYKWSVEDM